jgi:predicted nuclease of predicted toxin-antitoxin system
LGHAKAHNLALVSYDYDFSELSALLGAPPKVIWLRRSNLPTAVVEQILRERAFVIAEFENDHNTACLEIY